MTLSIDLVSSSFLPHLGLVGADDSSVDSHWIPTWSSWPAGVTSLVHPVAVSFLDRVIITSTLVVVEVCTHAHVTSVKVVVLLNTVRELNLYFLCGAIAIFGITEHVAIGTSKVVEAVHIIDSLDLLFEEIWVVSEQVADIHWETDGCDGNGVVWLSFQDVDVSILSIWNIT